MRGWVTKTRLGNSESGGHRSQGGKKTNVLLFTNKDISVLVCGLYSLYNAFPMGPKVIKTVGRWSAGGSSNDYLIHFTKNS